MTLRPVTAVIEDNNLIQAEHGTKQRLSSLTFRFSSVSVPLKRGVSSIINLFTVPIEDDHEESGIPSSLRSSSKVAPAPFSFGSNVNHKPARADSVLKLRMRSLSSSMRRRRASAEILRELADSSQRRRSLNESTISDSVLAKERDIFREVGNPADSDGSGLVG